MKEGTLDLFDKASNLLMEADLMVEVGLYEAAGRNTYLATRCAARALVFEDSGHVVSRHRSLWGDVTGVLHVRGKTDAALSGLLPSLYVLKRIADYETGSSEITEDRAAKAVAEAKNYVPPARAETCHPLPGISIPFRAFGGNG